MKAYNPIECLAEALYSAVHDPKIFPNLSYRSQTPDEKKAGIEPKVKFRRPRAEELEVYHFPQGWGSTALGFGGIGGAAMTDAYTTVVSYNEIVVAVFFGGRHAYTIDHPNKLFWEDIGKHCMASVSGSKKYS